MPKMEAVIRITKRYSLDSEVPDAEFVSALPETNDGPGLPAEKIPLVMKNEPAVMKARIKAAKDAEALAKDLQKNDKDVIDVLVEGVMET